MKILMLSNSDGGLYKFRKELIQTLVDDGNKVFLSLPEGEYISLLKGMGCTFYSTPVDRRGMNPFKDIQLLLQYNRLIHKIKPEIVLTYTIKPNIYGGIICRRHRVKYIANITGLGTAIENHGILSRILLFWYKVALKDASQVFFQNESNRIFFRKKRVVRKNRMIPGSGVNLEEHRYEEYPNETEGVCLLYVGRIMKDKGIEELLVGAEKLKRRHSNLCFDLAGEYDEEEYRGRVTELEKKGVVRYLGLQADIHSVMKTHHAIVLPSYHEGLSNVLLEAAACGRPVLTTDVPGCRETFEDGVSGIGFEAQSAEALVRAVEKFLALSHEEKRDMGLRGRRKVEKEFDRQIVINAYMQEISRLKDKE